jgi:hypothetical protein
MRYPLLVAFLFFANLGYACSCAHWGLPEHFDHAEFVGVVEIISIQKRRDYRDDSKIEIRPLEIFKGKEIEAVFTTSSNCAFVANVGSKWLVYADAGEDGKMNTSYCSGNLNFESVVDSAAYPTLRGKLERRLQVKLEILRSLKRNNITRLYNSSLYATGSFESLKGYSEEKSFGIYRLGIGPDLAIARVEAVDGFENQELSGEITKFLKTQKLVFRGTGKTPTNEKREIVMILFNYPQEEGYPSFISTSDL